MESSNTAFLPEKQERIEGRRTKVKIRLFKLDQNKGPALDATLPTPKVEEKVSIWSSQMSTAQQAIKKSLQEHKAEADCVLQKYSVEEAGTVKEQEAARQEVKESCVRSLAETHAAQSEQARDWAELQGLTNPMTLHASVKQEIEKATKVLDNNSRLAARLLELLRSRDELYAKTLRIGGDKTDKMLQLLFRQALDLQQRCSQQLEAAEAVFLQKQSEHEGKRRAELESRLEQHKLAEQQHIAKYVKVLQSYQDQLGAIDQSSNTEHEGMRKGKEEELHELKQHLENMKATFVSNAELLKYNERVLKGRKPETQATIIHQKRRMADQREVLAKLKQRAAAVDKTCQEEHFRLVSEHQRRVDSIEHQLNKQRTYHRKNDCTFEEVQKLKISMLEALQEKKLMLGNMICRSILDDDGAEVIDAEAYKSQQIALSAEEAWFLLEQSLQEYHSMLAGPKSCMKPMPVLKAATA